jgi:predicted small secreted protein
MTKTKRHIFILIALVALALSSLACDLDNGYTVIQEGQNTIKEAGNDIKEAVSDNEFLNAPTGIEQNTGGLIDILGNIVEDEASKE